MIKTSHFQPFWLVAAHKRHCQRGAPFNISGVINNGTKMYTKSQRCISFNNLIMHDFDTVHLADNTLVLLYFNILNAGLLLATEYFLQCGIDTYFK